MLDTTDNIIDGLAIANAIQDEIKKAIKKIKGPPPCLSVILVGNHPASEIYIRRKTKACEMVGITSILKHFPESIPEEDLLAEIQKLNSDPTITGILVQLPLPPHIDPNSVTFAIDPKKDVDGFHPLNMGKLLNGDKHGLYPCTPLGIKAMLDRSDIVIDGKHVLIIGRSNIVGKPMAAMLIQRTQNCNATVTITNRKTKNMKELCDHADIIIIAIGQPKFLTAEMVKKGTVVVDVGINRVTNPSSPKGYDIVGDADFEALKHKCSHITPVPGGVGPMTIAMLLSNTLKSYKMQL